MKTLLDDINNIKQAINYCLETEVRNLANESLDKLETLTLKATPTKPTHEETSRSDDTCPNCGNVCSTLEKWGTSVTKITSDYCKYCGQALDWSE